MLSYLYSLLMPSADDFSMEGTEGGGRGGESVSGKQSAFYEKERGGGGIWNNTSLARMGIILPFDFSTCSTFIVRAVKSPAS